MRFIEITHFAKNDPDCSSDYLSIELIDENGNQVLNFIDGYHESGPEIIEGFILGVEYATKQKVELIKQDTPDGPEQVW